MKAFLILCLLCTLNCDILSTLICLVQSEPLRNFISVVVAKIPENNLLDLGLYIFGKFEEIKAIFTNCINPNDAITFK